MDEKSGMNFSEYMALLSSNTDLLDKAKLEKRIASLEEVAFALGLYYLFRRQTAPRQSNPASGLLLRSVCTIFVLSLIHI